MDGGGPGHLVWMEEGRVTRCGWRRARSLGVDGGGPGHSVWMEEGQVTWCGWRRARSLGVDGGGPVHLVWMGRARSLGEDGGGPGHLVWMGEGLVTWCGWKRARSLGVDGECQVTRCGCRRVDCQRESRGDETARPQLRREDCVRRGVRKAEEGDKGRGKAASREEWKGITAAAVQQE